MHNQQPKQHKEKQNTDAVAEPTRMLMLSAAPSGAEDADSLRLIERVGAVDILLFKWRLVV
jgi:hypothetical protein